MRKAEVVMGIGLSAWCSSILFVPSDHSNFYSHMKSLPVFLPLDILSVLIGLAFAIAAHKDIGWGRRAGAIGVSVSWIWIALNLFDTSRMSLPGISAYITLAALPWRTALGKPHDD